MLNMEEIVNIFFSVLMCVVKVIPMIRSATEIFLTV